MAKITVKISPNAKQSGFAGEFAGVWRIRVDAPPKENKANRRLVEWLAEKLGISKSKIEILKGHVSSIKIIEIVTERSREDLLEILKKS